MSSYILFSENVSLRKGGKLSTPQIPKVPFLFPGAFPNIQRKDRLLHCLAIFYPLSTVCRQRYQQLVL